jgi:hypothetical protein
MAAFIYGPALAGAIAASIGGNLVAHNHLNAANTQYGANIKRTAQAPPPHANPPISAPTVSKRRKSPTTKTRRMAYGYRKYRTKRRRFKRRSRRRWRRKTRGIGFKALLSKTAGVKHRLDYSGKIGFAVTDATAFSSTSYYSTAGATYDFKLNSLHDPFASTHTPTLYDTMSGLYGRYVVKKCYVIIDWFDMRPTMTETLMSSAGTTADIGDYFNEPITTSVYYDTSPMDNIRSAYGPIMLGVHPVLASDTTYADFPYRVGCKTAYSKPGSSGRFVYKLDPNRFAGERSNLSNATVSCTVDGDPTKVVYLRLTLTRLRDVRANMCGNEITFNIRMYQEVEWGHPELSKQGG